ncbi:LOW QUALITY PROTEIN: serologically defined colon cancer antigen 3, partial [Seriola lalandi dorsalis]|uniref:LOW QUALITY PROTEIN: serologically defined colon cancer antigen 3 n=1 Tax=Seriola lalandi dorsalis TaxID=1841481 RepID=UPI000C6F5CBD
SPDEEVEDQELNPFSFREFLRWKNQDPHQEPEQEHQEEQTQGQSSSSQRVFDVRNLTLDPDAQTCFFSEPSLAPQEEEGENYEGDDETSMAEPATSCRRKSGRSSQVQQLKEENMLLRRTIRELQRRSDAKERRVLELSEELLHRRRQEEKEAQDLESMVHSVEQNLHLMTKRAVKAENSVSKLKLELQQLQVEVDSLQSENDSLKAAESQVVMTMRQNAHVASEYLKKTASHAHSSIRWVTGLVTCFLCRISVLGQFLSPW